MLRSRSGRRQETKNLVRSEERCVQTIVSNKALEEELSATAENVALTKDRYIDRYLVYFTTKR